MPKRVHLLNMNAENMTPLIITSEESSGADFCASDGEKPLQIFQPAIAQRLAEKFQLLGDATRVQLLTILSFAEGHEVCACHLAEALELTPATISHHMKRLVKGGLVAVNRKGRWAHYQLVPEGFEALRNVLDLSSEAPPGVLVNAPLSAHNS